MTLTQNRQARPAYSDACGTKDARGDEPVTPRTVTRDEQAQELLFSQTGLLFTFKLRQFPPISLTTQIHAFKPRGRNSLGVH